VTARLLILATAILAAIMSAAMVLWMTHRRRPECSAPLYREDDDGIPPPM
jgi:hypothetical protein